MPPRALTIRGRQENSRRPAPDSFEFEFNRILPGRYELNFLGHRLPIDLPPDGLQGYQVDLVNLETVEILISDDLGRPLGPDRVVMTQNPLGTVRFSSSRAAFLPISRQDDVKFWVLGPDGQRQGPVRRIRESELNEERIIEYRIGPPLLVEFVLACDHPKILRALGALAGAAQIRNLVNIETLEGRSVLPVATELKDGVLEVWFADPGRYRIAIDPRFGYAGKAEVEVERGEAGVTQAPPRVSLPIELVNDEIRQWIGPWEEDG